MKLAPDLPLPRLPARFELQRALGRGGTGRVFEVFDHARDEPVALKTLDDLDANGILRIKDEFRVLTGLTHPNLVRLHELHEFEGSWFFTMERVYGVSFRHWVRDLPPGTSELDTIDKLSRTHEAFRPHGEVTVPELAVDGQPLAPPAFDEVKLRAAFVQLARALCAVHASGRLHRDLKPSNVMVANGRVVLFDFGIASALGARADGHGTVGYMAPEQLGDGDVLLGPEVDWYAAGVMLYEALTGVRPFVGTPVQVMSAKLFSTPVGPERRARNLPDDLARLCTELIQTDPRKRAGARAVFSVVSERAVERHPVSLRPDPPLVGRGAVLSAIEDGWREVDRGPITIEVRGPEGMGRTRVLEEAQRLFGEEALVISVRCDLRESIPYRGVEQLVDALVREERAHRSRGGTPRLIGDDAAGLADVFPVVRSVIDWSRSIVIDPTERRARAFNALGGWIAAIARERPILITLDDAQELDDDGLFLLRWLLNPPAPLRLVVLAANASDRRLMLPEVRSLELEPLGEDEQRRLLATLGATVDDLRSTRGRPGWLLDLAEGHRASVDVEHRLARLSSSQRTLMQLITLAHAPPDMGGLALAMHANRVDVASWIDALRAQHLVRVESRPLGEVFRPMSRAVGRAVRAAIEDERGCHAALAAAFHNDHSATARHLEAAGDSSGALREALAGTQLAEHRLAFEQASELALLAARVDPDRRSMHLARAGRALMAAGRGGPAADAFLEAAASSPQEDAFEYRRAAASELLRAGHVDRGLEVLAEVLGRVGLDVPPSAAAVLPRLAFHRLRLWMRGSWDVVPGAEMSVEQRMRADACRTASMLMTVDVYLGAYFQTLFLRAALDAADPARLAAALAHEAPLLASAGRGARAAEAIGLARRLAAESDSLTHALIDGLEGFSILQQGDWIAAEACLSKAHRELLQSSHGLFWELVTLEAAHNWSLAMLGDLRALRASVHQTRAAAAARGDVFGATSLVVGLATWSWLIDDEPLRARAIHAAAMRPWSQRGFHIQHLFHEISEATVELYIGEADAAGARLEAIEGKLMRSQLLQNQLLRVTWWDLVGRIALARGRRAKAGRAVRKLKRTGAAWGAALATLLEACLDNRASGGGAQRFAAAAEQLQTLGMHMHAAVARHRLAELGDYGQPLSMSAWGQTQRPAKPERIIDSLAPRSP